MKFTSDRPIMIFRFEDNNKVKYTYAVGKKKTNSEEYENAFFPIQFKQGVSIENKQKIMIKNAFPSFYSWEFQGKKGNTFYIMCTEFEKVYDGEPIVETEKEEDPFAAFGDTVQKELDNNFLD
jgi:hypothetical protein